MGDGLSLKGAFQAAIPVQAFLRPTGIVNLIPVQNDTHRLRIASAEIVTSAESPCVQIRVVE